MADVSYNLAFSFATQMRTSEKIILEKMNYISVSQYSSHSDFLPIASVYPCIHFAQKDAIT